jgi:hypothetical protein
MTTVQTGAVAGIVLNLVGVLFLFRYGMPFRIETKGAGYIMLEQTDHDAIRVEQRYRRLGNLGLILVVSGSALQIFAVLLA